MSQVPSVLLVHPPVSRPCEPPAGVAKLAGALARHRVDCKVFDANLYCLFSLLGQEPDLTDTWNRRAWTNLPGHLRSIRELYTYRNPDRYSRAVRDISRLLDAAGRAGSSRITLANYSHEELSPLRSHDLLKEADHPEKNPFFSSFSLGFSEIFEDDHPTVVGFSLNYLAQALTCFSMIGHLRKLYNRLTIVLGGGLVTSWMSRPGWSNPFGGLVDEMVCGPGEERLLEACNAGSFSVEGQPDYTWALNCNYLSPGFILPYSASTGCYWRRCAFCPEKAEKNPYRPVSDARVITELQGIVKDTAASLIHFLDNTMSPTLLNKLAEGPPLAPWYGFVRVSDLLGDRDFAFSLRNSGCVMLKIGLESGDQDVLDKLDKGIDLAVASRVIKALHGAGIATYIYLLFGTPPEREESAFKTLEYTAAHSDYIDFLNLAIFNMPAWGSDAEIYETRDFYDGDLILYKDFVHPLGWDRSKVRRFVDKVFRRHPAVGDILRKDAPVFTSNHAPFFCIARHI